MGGGRFKPVQQAADVSGRLNRRLHRRLQTEREDHFSAGYPSAGSAPSPSSRQFVCRFLPPVSRPFVRLRAPAINITPRGEREGPVAGRRATRCSSMTNRWRTPGLALTAQLAANEPNASLAPSVAAARLYVGALAFAASLRGDT